MIGLKRILRRVLSSPSSTRSMNSFFPTLLAPRQEARPS